MIVWGVAALVMSTGMWLLSDVPLAWCGSVNWEFLIWLHRATGRDGGIADSGFNGTGLWGFAWGLIPPG